MIFFVHLMDVKSEENNGVLAGVPFSLAPIPFLTSSFPLTFPFEVSLSEETG